MALKFAQARISSSIQSSRDDVVDRGVHTMFCHHIIGAKPQSSQDFDAVAVATSGLNAPKVPDIKGLDEWGTQFPNSVYHSRRYRRPQRHANETILIIGSSVCL